MTVYEQFTFLDGYSTTGYNANTLYTYKVVYDTGKHFPLVLMLLWEQLVFLFYLVTVLWNTVLIQ